MFHVYIYMQKKLCIGTPFSTQFYPILLKEKKTKLTHSPSGNRIHNPYIYQEYTYSRILDTTDTIQISKLIKFTL